MNPYATHQLFLEHYINKTRGDIVEFGTGDGSTGMILKLIKGTNRKLISIENDKTWYDKMLHLYPPSNQHIYHFVTDWESFISSMEQKKYSIVFIDQSPWEARVTTLHHFKDFAEYVIVHDVDYLARNRMVGKQLSEFVCDFSDVSNEWKMYYPLLPWPSSTGPPTLVFSNTGHKVDKLILGMHMTFGGNS